MGKRLAIRIGLAIKRLRREHDLTQADLVDKARLSQVTISAIELGKHYARVDHLDSIARCFRVKLSDLMKLAENIIL